MTVAHIESELARLGLSKIELPLHDFLPQQRWFGAKQRGIRTVSVHDLIEIAAGPPACVVVLVRVDYVDGGYGLYNVALGIAAVDDNDVARVPADATITRTPALVIYDALADRRCLRYLWRVMAERHDVRGTAGTLQAVSSLTSDSLDGEFRHIATEQSNSSVVRGQSEILKWMRRVELGASIEEEMLESLVSAHFDHVPEPLGALDYVDGSERTSIALLQRFIPNTVDGWSLALSSVAQTFDSGAPAATTYVNHATRLGEVTASMHGALSRATANAMAPRAVTAAMLNDWADDMIAALKELAFSEFVLERLGSRIDALVGHFNALRTLDDGGIAIRIHGDYHLGQVLHDGHDWYVIDFEGEPARPVQQRRGFFSPLRDVAGMLRSFDYAAVAALHRYTSPEDSRWNELRAIGKAWSNANREAFWSAYTTTLSQSGDHLIPASAVVLRQAFEYQKAVYELKYELEHRPDWVEIPLQFLLAA